jgi:hypothetical protein
MLRPYQPAQSRRKVGPYEMTGEVAARPSTDSSFDKLRMSGTCLLTVSLPAGRQACRTASGTWPLMVSLPALSTAEGSNHERATWAQQPW